MTTESIVTHDAWQAKIAHAKASIKNPLVLAQQLINWGAEIRPLGFLDLAIDCFQSTLDVIQVDAKIQLHAWLSEIYAELQQFESAKIHFDQTITLEHARKMALKPTQNVVSFSLYGELPEYCETAILNAQLMPEIYPDWLMVVYHDDSVPAHVIQRLQQFKAKTVHVNTINASHMVGTFWRFLALENKEYNVVIFRDADSLISEREKVLVDEWLNSNYPFHVIRDWYSQSDLMLAGLWGAKYGLLHNIRQLIEDYLAKTPVLHPTHADQRFLAEEIWTRISDFTLHHTWITDRLNASWVSSLPTVSKNTEGLGAFLLTTYTPTMPPHITGYMYTVTQGEQIICEYQNPLGGSFTLPRSYGEKIKTNEYQLKIQGLPYSITIIKPTT